jgi:ferredoxin-NADP reductase
VDSLSVAVRIRALEPLNDGVRKVLLEPVDPGTMFSYRPGQYLTLINAAGIARSYSMANDFEQDQAVELHVAATRHGVFTRWLFEEAKVGEVLRMRGPAGECFYDARDLDAASTPLVLAGTGTGLAPLYGIARDALHQGHRGPIQLFHGSARRERLYYCDAMHDLSRAHPNFRYYPCVLETPGEEPHQPGGLRTGPLENVVEGELQGGASLAHTRVYLCGAPGFVHGLRKRIFLKGVRSGHIRCDPFIERTVAPA